MDYLKIEDMAKLWEISPRRLQTLCAEGRVDGAVRFGRAWMIPVDAHRPVDGRSKAGRAQALERLDADRPLPRKSPFLYMTDLYRIPGTADAVAQGLIDNREAYVLFQAEVAYARGEIDKVYEHANYLLGKRSGFYAVLAAGMLLAMCAIWQGDIVMWRRAKNHIAEAPAKNDNDLDMMQLAISAVDIMVYNVNSFPEWFKIGCFEPVHVDAYPAAKVYYAKYLYACGYAVATGALQMEGMSGLSMMQMLPNLLEPMICWAVAERTVISEIYLRLICAAVYHSTDRDEQAIRHIDRAVNLALQDRLYGLLAEYGRVLGDLLEKRIVVADPAAWEQVKRLYRGYHDGWLVISGTVRGKTIARSLSNKQREVAKLAAFGLSNTEIAARMEMSLSAVKQTLLTITDKTGVGRDEFAGFL